MSNQSQQQQQQQQPLYEARDVVEVNDNGILRKVELTGLVSSSTPIGYSGVYNDTYRGTTIQMTMSWIPQGLIKRVIDRTSWH